MAVLTEVNNLSAGTVLNADNSPGLAAELAASSPALTGVTVNAQGNYESSDGVELKSGGGKTTVVDLDLATAEDKAAIKELAELTFLAQTTSVNSNKLNASYEKLGLNPNDTRLAEEILEASGYTPGVTNGFFDGAGGYTGTDQGINILIDRYKDMPTDEDLIDAGLDPSEYTAVHSNAAEAFYVEEKLKEMGLSGANTNAIMGSTARFLGGNLSSLGMQGAASVQDVRDESDRLTGTNNSEKYLDIYEWDLLKKKKPLKPKAPGSSGSTGNVSGINTPGGGQITGGSAGSFGNLAYVSTPLVGNATPIYDTGLTGLSEVTLPNYSQGLQNQETEFTNRAATQAGYYQPQTQTEKESLAASDPNYTAPAFESVLYRNRFGMTQYIQHINGVPSQPIPPGYFRVTGFGTEDQGAAAATAANQGGMIQGFNDGAIVNPAINFQPGGAVVEQDGIYRIKYPDGTYSQGYNTANNAANALNMGMSKLGLPDYNTYLTNQGIDRNLPGYDETQYRNMYQSYVQDPATLQNIKDQASAEEKEDLPPQTGGINQGQPTEQTTVTSDDLAQAQRDLVAQSTVAPGGAVAAAPTSYINPNAYGTVTESTAGQAIGVAPMVRKDQVAQIGTATTADVPQKIGAGQVDAQQAYSDIQNATAGMDAAQLSAPTKTIDAQQQVGTSVADLTEATGTSTDVTKPVARTVEKIDGTSELVSGTGVDQTKVGQAFGTGEVQAASVQNELANLMAQFDDGQTPAWAAGSMRAASQMLAARGLGASSLAGQAVIQAAMEAALPIAQIDASNKQQVALVKAEQRAKFLQLDFDQEFQAKVVNASKISEIANINFSSEQQIALENSKAANTMGLQNLTNEQALIMAEAAALSQLDTQNLNNRQQAAVQNAQNFLQVDMSNLSNSQQTALFKQQSLISSILSDQAAANAAQQFNATSENQTNQFFANLAASVNQFNAAQINAMKQFNADEVNSLLEFNAGIQNQREMFNAQNYLVVAQANAQWRQNLATINTAAANEVNREYAQTVNALTLKTLDEIWQRERDLMDYSFTSSENSADRALSILLGDKKLDALRLELDSQEDQALGGLMAKIFFSSDTKSIFS